MFSEFLNTLNSLRQRTARFRRVVLHLHSPDSHDWGRTATDTARNDPSRFKGESGIDAFIDELRPHLDCVAVTDHMKCTFATQLSARTAGNSDLMILPGMEANFRLEPPLGFARIHLLVLLPEGSTPYDFARLLEGLDIPADDNKRNGQEEISGLSLRDWTARVHRNGGLCIAAHVENKEGIRYRFRQAACDVLEIVCEEKAEDVENANEVPHNLKQFLLDSGFDAIEIHRSKDSKHFRWVSDIDGRTRSIATTLTSDAHCVEEFGRQERMTHIKMTRLGLQGLREALRFPDTRIRFSDSLPSPIVPQLLGIQVIGGQASFFDNIAIAFAENLNCLIGVRGSGKSTVVEALRYVFGYNRTLNELDKLRDTIVDMQKANLTDSMIRVAYRTGAGEDRVLEATFDDKSAYVTKVFATSGEAIEVADVEASDDYPLRLFGWSEIETLGRSPSKQRDLLDRLVPELSPVTRKRESIRVRLRANRGVVAKCVEEVKAAFEQEVRLIERFREFKGDFEKLNTPAVQGLFSAWDLAQDKRRILAQLTSNVTVLIDSLSAPSAITLRTDVDSLLDKGSQELRDWWHQEELSHLRIIDAELEIRKSVQQAIERARAFAELVAEHTKRSDEESEKLQKELRDAFAADDSMQRIADLRTNAEERLRRVTELRNQYRKQWEVLTNTLAERNAIAEELSSVQNEIAGIRSKHNIDVEETLNRFLPVDMQVSIQLNPGRDTGAFADSLYKIFGAKGHKPKGIRQVVERYCTPISFAEMIVLGNFDCLVGKATEVEGKEWEFAEAVASDCHDTTTPFEHNDHADVETLSNDGRQLNAILDLQETPWDDCETILLNGGPVNEKSPGQRSSAMLPLIALAETTPLVIDQPEDNLDKRLIGSVLMKVLAELKEKRQIIVCTHDPNIVVGGDAEQVIVLEAESDRKGKVHQHGSIDNEDIVESVVNLLEGGAEAFENRRKRYCGHAGITS